MDDRLIAAQRERMAWMPWLYHRAKPAVAAWARPWQAELRAALASLEDVTLHPDCFIAPSARIFAEPRRPVVVGARSSVAAECFIHGPVELGEDVSINPRGHVDGGAAGVRIGDGARIGAGVQIFAWDHGMAPDAPIHEQPTRSRGVEIGADVWIGAGVGITDGVKIGDHAVVAMHAVVTRDVPAHAKVAGVPARIIGDRRG